MDGVKSEFNFSYTYDQWNDMNNEAKPLSPPPWLSPAIDAPPETKAAPPSPQAELAPSAEATNNRVPDSDNPESSGTGVLPGLRGAFSSSQDGG